VEQFVRFRVRRIHADATVQVGDACNNQSRFSSSHLISPFS
jgi:hypothetical protein